MNRLPVILLALAVSACASSPGSPPPQGGPEAIGISLPPATPLGEGGGTVVLTVHRDARGSRHLINASPEQVWPALIRVYEALEIPLATIDRTQHRLGNPTLVLRRRLAGEPISRFLDCGQGPFGAPLADSYEINLSVLTSLEPAADGSTQIETRLNARAVNRGVSGAPVHCASTGRLEERIVQRIQQRLDS